MVFEVVTCDLIDDTDNMAALVRLGPEYVDQIPPANPIVSGSLDGERYWVVDGREVPRCDGSPSGVELITEECPSRVPDRGLTSVL